jgi:hypothetical protein
MIRPDRPIRARRQTRCAGRTPPHTATRTSRPRRRARARQALANLGERYAREKRRLKEKLRIAEADAEVIRDGLLYGTGRELVEAVTRELVEAVARVLAAAESGDPAWTVAATGCTRPHLSAPRPERPGRPTATTSCVRTCRCDGGNAVPGPVRFLKIPGAGVPLESSVGIPRVKQTPLAAAVRLKGKPAGIPDRAGRNPGYSSMAPPICRRCCRKV